MNTPIGPGNDCADIGAQCYPGSIQRGQCNECLKKAADAQCGGAHGQWPDLRGEGRGGTSGAPEGCSAQDSEDSQQCALWSW